MQMSLLMHCNQKWQVSSPCHSRCHCARVPGQPQQVVVEEDLLQQVVVVVGLPAGCTAGEKNAPEMVAAGPES